MNALDRNLRQVRDLLKLYAKHPEGWEKDPERWNGDTEMHRFELEEAISLGIYLFKRISRIDETWRTAVFNDCLSYEAEFEKQIERLYQTWAKPQDDYKKELAALRLLELDVEGREEFIRCCQEVQGILTPDENYFTHDSLVNLRDRAIKANQRGKTLEGLSD